MFSVILSFFKSRKVTIKSFHFPLRFLLFIYLVNYGCAFSQTTRGPIDPPLNVSEAFAKDNANAIVENIVWWQGANHLYIVDFTKKNYKQRAYYTLQGTWKYTEISIPIGSVKQKIFSFLDKNYTYDSFEAFFHDEKNNNFYLIVIKSGGKTRNLKFDENSFQFLGDEEGYIHIPPLSTDQQDWVRLKSKNSIDSYNQYLKTHPNGQYRAEAKEELKTLYDKEAWGDAKKAKTIKNYEQYLNTYPKGKYKAIAKKRLEILYDKVAWAEAKKINTLGSYSKYLNNFPNGTYESKAETFSSSILKTEADNLSKKLTTLINFGNDNILNSDFNQAINNYSEGISILDKSYFSAPKLQATLYNNLGNAFKAKGEFNKAILNLNYALKLDKVIYGEKSQAVAIDYNNLGLVYAELGELDSAIYFVNKALNIDSVIFGTNSRIVATRYNNIGVLYKRKDNYKVAEKLVLLGLTIDYSLISKSDDVDQKIVNKLNNLAGIYLKQNRLIEAEETYRKVLKINEQILERDDLNILYSYLNLSRVLKNRNKYRDAILYLEKSLSLFPNITGTDKEQIYVELLNCNLQLNNFNKSELILIELASINPEYIKFETSIIEKRQNLINSIGIKMVYVPGGRLNKHNLKVTDFQISKFEITIEQWQKVTKNSEIFSSDSCMNCPVTSLSFSQIDEFISKLNEISGRKYRLPMEDEWEFAAIGGISGKKYSYAGSNNIQEVAWFKDNSENKLKPVGMKKSNKLGLYDLSGNVWEWCSLEVESTDRAKNFILKGGSWHDPMENCLIEKKVEDIGKIPLNAIGFRLVLSE